MRVPSVDDGHNTFFALSTINGGFGVRRIASHLRFQRVELGPDQSVRVTNAHPLDFDHGQQAWRCPKDGALVTALQLPPRVEPR